MLIKGIPQNAGTCDGILMGDGEREVRRIATCHKLTFDVLSAASATGTDMILTHEPPFANGNSPAEDLTPDAEKARRIAESGIAVLPIRAGRVQALPVPELRLEVRAAPALRRGFVAVHLRWDGQQVPAAIQLRVIFMH